MAAVVFPTVLTATEASRSFAAVLERARDGESFIVTRNGERMAQIAPPPVAEPNGGRLVAFLQTWTADSAGFTDEIVAAIEALDEPVARNQERLAWVDGSF